MQLEERGTSRDAEPLSRSVARLAACRGGPEAYAVKPGALLSKPDRVVFVPQRPEHATNQHFLVTVARSGDFLAFWTRASQENAPDQHVAMSRSSDCPTVAPRASIARERPFCSAWSLNLVA